MIYSKIAQGLTSVTNN